MSDEKQNKRVLSIIAEIQKQIWALYRTEKDINLLQPQVNSLIAALRVVQSEGSLEQLMNYLEGQTAEIDTLETTTKTLDSVMNNVDASKKTMKEYRMAMNLFFTYVQKDISEIKREDVLNWKKQLLEKGLKARTIRAYISAAKTFFRAANMSWVVDGIEIKKIKIPREDVVNEISLQDVGRVLAYIETIEPNSLLQARNRAMVLLLTTTGVRVMVIANSNIEDVRDGMLYYRQKGEIDTSSTAVIPVVTMDAINEYLRLRQCYRPSDPLFVAHSRYNNGARLSISNLSTLINNLYKKAGIYKKGITAHGLRGTAAKEVEIETGDIKCVQNFLHHRNIVTTEIYLRRKKQKDEKVGIAANKIGTKVIEHVNKIIEQRNSA